jgi:hypothetical protein
VKHFGTGEVHDASREKSAGFSSSLRRKHVFAVPMCSISAAKSDACECKKVRRKKNMPAGPSQPAQQR